MSESEKQFSAESSPSNEEARRKQYLEEHMHKASSVEEAIATLEKAYMYGISEGLDEPEPFDRSLFGDDIGLARMYAFDFKVRPDELAQYEEHLPVTFTNKMKELHG